ncbi:hypothetical protein T4B_8498 [Trichinella pseudospiralis]|uniref:Uncharacterized protein n=1 Tax=Trichinella pseudospiralis TaxID=6337 RepID=A0A0V1EF57_TRIPS|nr:hypothetical protein T4A_7123 [Trichinella pseudospiralis]KRZ24531.1 hypothetical protein T4B_8498 [Trichinella pseudospiralis]KRZ31063.1 hypothetical protein T4C_1931 [Trichinella pseudospiralis]
MTPVVMLVVLPGAFCGFSRRSQLYITLLAKSCIFFIGKSFFLKKNKCNCNICCIGAIAPKRSYNMFVMI